MEAVIYSFISWSRRMFFVVYTDTKLNKLYLSIIGISVFFGWTFVVLVRFWTIQYCSVWGGPNLGRFKTHSVPGNFEKISKKPLRKNPISFAIVRWFIFLAIVTVFILITLENFAILLDVRNFTILKKKFDAIAEIYLHISDEIFFHF